MIELMLQFIIMRIILSGTMQIVLKRLHLDSERLYRKMLSVVKSSSSFLLQGLKLFSILDCFLKKNDCLLKSTQAFAATLP